MIDELIFDQVRAGICAVGYLTVPDPRFLILQSNSSVDGELCN